MGSHAYVPSGLKTPNAQDASVIKGMIKRGDIYQDIAAFFGVNPARIAEIKFGKRHLEVPPCEVNALPPKGPYRFNSAA